MGKIPASYEHLRQLALEADCLFMAADNAHGQKRTNLLMRARDRYLACGQTSTGRVIERILEGETMKRIADRSVVREASL